MERSPAELKRGSALAAGSASVSALLAAEMVAVSAPGAALIYAGITAVSLVCHFSYQNALDDRPASDK